MGTRHRLSIVALLLSGLLPMVWSPSLAQPQASQTETTLRGKPLLEAARGLYLDTQFIKAAVMLEAAILEGRVTGDDYNVARELRARCLAKADKTIEAKEAFKSILRSNQAYRPSEAEVPPDERKVFVTALKEFQAEQVEAGKRFPASIAFDGGFGNAVNQDLADLASSAGVAQADDFAEDAEFSYSVRFPLKPRLSIDFQVTRLRATTEDKLPATRNAHAEYTSEALPFAISLVHNFSSSPTRHVNGFAGAGPMPCQAILEFPRSLVAGRVIPSQVVGHHLGWYLAAGVEGEWLLKPRFAITGRVLARRANSGKLDWPSTNYDIYETFDDSTLDDREIDFSGIAAGIGVRAYIGY